MSGGGGGARHTWPEPVVRVQSLAETGMDSIPKQYIRPPCSRPSSSREKDVEIPAIDLGAAVGGDGRERQRAAEACREWGIMQIVNHGVPAELRRNVREAWRKFFAEATAEEKEEYANSPESYEGYGSRMGVEEGAVLDWSDYFFLHYYSPLHLTNPSNCPPSSRKVTEEYGEEMMKLCKKMMRVLSENPGLSEDYVEKAFGGEKEMGDALG